MLFNPRLKPAIELAVPGLGLKTTIPLLISTPVPGTMTLEQELVSQVASLTYRYDVRRRLQLEQKSEIRRRGQQSPDKADALAIAFSQLAEHGSGQALIITGKNTWAKLRRARREDPRCWRHT